MYGWLTLAAAIVFNVLGNVFIKRFSLSSEINSSLDYLNLQFLLGAFFFAVGLLLYTRALKEVPLTLAYPVMVGVSLTAISLLAIFWLGEQFTVRVLVGSALVIGGIAVLSQAA